MCGTGLRQGRVIKPPTAAVGEKVMDGLLAYNEGQTSFYCSFGAFQVLSSTACLSCCEALEDATLSLFCFTSLVSCHTGTHC